MSIITPLKVAVFGGSSYGKSCLKYILGNSDAEFVGFYEKDEETASSLLSLFDIKRFTAFEELLDIVDAVIIALPVEERYKTAAAALRKGKHILVESPVSYKPSEMEDLISVANEAQVAHTVSIGGILSRADLEKEPQFIDSKRYIDSSRSGSRNVFEILVEDIHLFIKMMNSGIKKVRKNIIGKNIAVRFEFENETVAHYLLIDTSSSSQNLPNLQEIVIYNTSEIISIKEKEDVAISVKKDIDTFFCYIYDNSEQYPFFEKELISIDAASKII
ncbi:MAG: Gfo/Idh/MocA family oxidoreductase [Bacteroidales bacterium]|nr:Gfo/Idh/MocA family oxidoreductase [Bacteroidales bacterium]